MSLGLAAFLSLFSHNTWACDGADNPLSCRNKVAAANLLRSTVGKSVLSYSDILNRAVIQQEMAIYGTSTITKTESACFFPHLVSRPPKKEYRGYQQAWFYGCFKFPSINTVFEKQNEAYNANNLGKAIGEFAVSSTN